MMYANQLIKLYIFSLLFFLKRKDTYAWDTTELSVFVHVPIFEPHYQFL